MEKPPPPPDVLHVCVSAALWEERENEMLVNEKMTGRATGGSESQHSGRREPPCALTERYSHLLAASGRESHAARCAVAERCGDVEMIISSSCCSVSSSSSRATPKQSNAGCRLLEENLLGSANAQFSCCPENKNKNKKNHGHNFELDGGFK